MTLGGPEAAPSGTCAETERLLAASTLTSMSPALPWKRTFLTSPRCLPVSEILDPDVTVRTPPQVFRQRTSFKRGVLGASTPPPPAWAEEAIPAPTESAATAVAAAVRFRQAGRLRGLGPNSVSLSSACGVSCRARAERAALRTAFRFAPGRPEPSFVPPAPACRAAGIRQVVQVGQYIPGVGRG